MKPIWFPLAFALPWCLLAYIGWKNYPWWRTGSYYDATEKYGTPVVAALMAVLATMVLCGIAVAISNCIGSAADKVWSQCWSADMVSLRNAEGVHGKIAGGIFMLAGSVGTSEVYFYYTHKPDGGFQPHKWQPDSDTTIFEEDREGGRIVQFEIKFKNSWVEWFGSVDNRYRMDFHIPRGSIQRQFSLK